MMSEKLILLIGKTFLSITRIESIDISILEASKYKSHHYNIMVMKSIFMLYSVILGIPNLTIKLSQESKPICVMVQ